MIEVLKTEYWSKADAYLLPLTGLKKNDGWEKNAYLFWNDYTIEDYKLILVYSYNDSNAFREYCMENVFPILNSKASIQESYDVPESTQTKNKTIFVLDMSEWAKDIEMFLAGKYSKLGSEVKKIIQRYHVFEGSNVPLHIYATLFPNEKLELLQDDSKRSRTPIEYVADIYRLDIDEINKIGQIGTIYSKEHETLLVNFDDICQSVITKVEGI